MNDYGTALPLGVDGNQCDGCRRGLVVENGQHRGPGGFWAGDTQGCTAHLYLGPQGQCPICGGLPCKPGCVDGSEHF